MPKYVSTNNQTSTLITSDGTVVRCLYVTNIPVNSYSTMQVVEKELITMLKSYGNIKQFYLKKNDQTKKNTYAFVTYATPEEAHRMYSARGQIRYRGRKLYVSVADSWHQPTVKPNGTVDYNPQWKSDNSKLQYILSNAGQNSKETGDDEISEEEEEEENEEEQEETEEVLENTAETQDAPIFKLNDDCFLLILDFIPFEHRHVLSHVCRSWRNLMKGYWAKNTELNFSKEPFSQVEFSEKRFELYLRLCPNITSVHILNKTSFTNRNPELATSQSIIKAATLCPKMKELTLNGIQLTGRPLAAVAHCCKHLRSLTIKTCKFEERDNEMNAIMRKCMKLEKLKLTNCSLKPGHWLRNLRGGLKCLSLLCCEMNNNNFIAGLHNVKSNLEELELVVDMCSDPLDFRKLQECKSLHSLTYVNRSVQSQRVFNDMFKNLKCLELEFNSFLTDELMRGLVTHSPGLTVFNIANSKDSKLTTEGHKAIAGLKDLVKLNLSMNVIEDEVLREVAENCSKLEVLSCNMCHKISDAGTKSVVSKLMKLRELHLDSCSNVTNKTVDAAIEAATQNPNKVKLSIFAAGCWSMFTFQETGARDIEMNPHPLVELSLDSRSDLNWMLCSSLQDFSDFFIEDDFSDDEDDDDDYDFDIYDEHDIYNYPYDSDEEFDFDMEDLNDLNPFSVYLNFL